MRARLPSRPCCAWALRALGAIGLALCAGLPALAQTMSLDLPQGQQLAVHGTGWQQLADPGELLLFIIDVAVTFGLAAVVAWHPSIAGGRETVAELELPKTLFIYALIAMTVGFLVMHHGYLIGFVIFGIGGLLRFRTSGDSAMETTRMILATVIGLCVGLDLPGVAVLITAVAAGVFYVLGLSEHHAVEVKFSDDKHLEEAIAAMRSRLALPGVTVVSTTRARFKSTVEFVLTTRRGFGTAAVEEELRRARADKAAGVSDWHID